MAHWGLLLQKQTKCIEQYYINIIPPTPIALDALSKAWNCGH